MRKFFIYPKNGEPKNIPIKEITSLAREDCEYCYDLTSESADISIGSIGSPAGWSTVLVRTKVGKEIFKGLVDKNYIEWKDLQDVQPGLNLLLKIAKMKRKNCTEHINKVKMEKEHIPQYY